MYFIVSQFWILEKWKFYFYRYHFLKVLALFVNASCHLQGTSIWLPPNIEARWDNLYKSVFGWIVVYGTYHAAQHSSRHMIMWCLSIGRKSVVEDWKQRLIESLK